MAEHFLYVSWLYVSSYVQKSITLFGRWIFRLGMRSILVSKPQRVLEKLLDQKELSSSWFEVALFPQEFLGFKIYSFALVSVCARDTVEWCIQDIFPSWQQGFILIHRSYKIESYIPLHLAKIEDQHRYLLSFLHREYWTR